MPYINIDLDEFDDDDLIEELRSRDFTIIDHRREKIYNDNKDLSIFDKNYWDLFLRQLKEYNLLENFMEHKRTFFDK